MFLRQPYSERFTGAFLTGIWKTRHVNAVTRNQHGDSETKIINNMRHKFKQRSDGNENVLSVQRNRQYDGRAAVTLLGDT